MARSFAGFNPVAFRRNAARDPYVRFMAEWRRTHISPEQQIRNVAKAFVRLLKSKRHPNRIDAIRSTLQQLLEMLDKHSRGELCDIPKDGTPF